MPATASWKDEASKSYLEIRERLLRERADVAQALKTAQARIRTIEAELSDLHRGARVFGLSVSGEVIPVRPDLDDSKARTLAPDDKIVVILKDQLVRAYPAPVTIPQVRKTVESQVHHAIPYARLEDLLQQLKDDGLASKRGCNWFSSSQLLKVGRPDHEDAAP